jgi:hypothetical protein
VQRRIRTLSSAVFAAFALALVGASPAVARVQDDDARAVNPCNTPDPGFGVYDRWQGVAMGQMLAPKHGGTTADGAFDLVIHFHGHEPARKEFVKTARGPVLVGIDLGIGSGPYEQAFASPEALPRLLASVEQAMKKRTGKPKARVRKLALTSWSAGYGAIASILRQPIASKVDAIVLLDSLHAGYLPGKDHEVDGARIAPFVARARAAARGTGFFFMSHSSIVPPGYASTTEVARFVLGQLGSKEKKARRHDVLGLEMVGRYDRGNLHVRGYAGDDKPDHCAHLGLLADVMRVYLAPRWHSPRARAR